MSYFARLRKLQEEENLKLVTYLKKRDVPLWFRGCSERQWASMEALQNAIRDDTEQETVHRVFHCLTTIGIAPIPNSDSLKLVMKLSGGNDLAFLWFLLEMFYKTTQTDEYTLNEQLIYSSIAHLDMITTLRGLDQVLPPGHASKQELAKLKRKQKELEKEKERENRRVRRRKRNRAKSAVEMRKSTAAPYFEKLPIPEEIPVKVYNFKKPVFKAKLFGYEIYKDVNYVPPNEANRWFAQMDNPSEEIREHLENIFKNYPLPKCMRRELANIIDIAFDRMDELRNCQGKCWHHLKEEEFAQIEANINNAKKQEYLKTYLSSSVCNKSRLNAVRTSLLKEIENYQLAFRKQAQNHGKKNIIRILEKNEFTEYFVRNSDDDPIDKSTQFESNGNVDTTSHTRITAGFDRSEKNKIFFKSYCEKYNYGHADSNTPNSSNCYFEAPKEHKPYSFDYAKIFQNDDNYNNMQEENIRKVLSKAFDVRNVQGSPEVLSEGVKKYIANVLQKFKKIKKRKLPPVGIAVTNSTISDKPESIKRTFKPKTKINDMRKAEHILEKQYLKMDPDYSLRLIRSGSIKINQKILDRSQRAKKYGRLSSKSFDKYLSSRKHPKDSRNSAMSRSSKDLTKRRKSWRTFGSIRYSRDFQIPKIATRASGERPVDLMNPINASYLEYLPPDMPRLTFYDCEDKQLMHNMLKIGIKHLAKNPKYVLAALPESYKLPLLREWIYRRYGKSYSKRQQYQSFAESEKIFRALNKLKLPINTLEMRNFITNVKHNYRCHNYVINRVRDLKRNFYNVMNQELLCYTRIFWLALRATLCHPAPRNMFFAYCPSQLADITNNRP